MPDVTQLVVNGAPVRVEADPGRTLLSVLRDDLDLTGAKYGCGEGRCGACTVLVDGEPVRSCQAKLSAVAGKRLTTIEGLAPEGNLHPVQQAFLDAGAFQCGYCTTGMILAGVALLEKNRDPGRDEVIKAMNGHICRCGTYPRILDALKRASAQLRSKEAAR